MIIPVKCFTCGTILADKYEWYLREVRKRKLANDMEPDAVVYLTAENAVKTPEGQVLDLLRLNRVCCRRHMLTNTDIE